MTEPRFACVMQIVELLKAGGGRKDGRLLQQIKFSKSNYAQR